MWSFDNATSWHPHKVTWREFVEGFIPPSTIKKEYANSMKLLRTSRGEGKRTWFWVPLVGCSKTRLDQDDERGDLQVTYYSELHKIVRVYIQFEFLPSEVLMI